MNRTHLHRPTSLGSPFQWSVADRTVAVCGTGSIGEQPPSGLILTARIADNRGRFAARHDRRHMQRKILSGKPLRLSTRPEVTAAEKKPRFGAYPHPDQTGFLGVGSRDMARCPFSTTNRPQPQPPFNIWESGRVVSKLRILAVDGPRPQPPGTSRGGSVALPNSRRIFSRYRSVVGSMFERGVVLLLGLLPQPGGPRPCRPGRGPSARDWPGCRRHCRGSRVGGGTPPPADRATPATPRTRPAASAYRLAFARCRPSQFQDAARSYRWVGTPGNSATNPLWRSTAR